MNAPATKYCHACGTTIDVRAEICPKCGVRQTALVSSPGDPRVREAASTKLTAGLCAIFLGSFGVHKFVLGYMTAGIIMALGTILTCGIGSIITGTLGLIEGIIYLAKSDEDFYQTYIAEEKPWF